MAKKTDDTLRLGASGAAVVVIAQLLAASGAAINPTQSFFDASMGNAVAYFQATHVDKQRQPLSVDGVVGPMTRWALENPSGQQLGLREFIPEGLSAPRRALLERAHSHHDVCESPIGSNRGPQIDRWTGYEYVSWSRPGPMWCAFYASGMYVETLGSYPLGGRIGSCIQTKQTAQARKCWHETGTPAPGDQFVMLYAIQNGEQHGHTGFVSSVLVSGGKTSVGTIEGNCGNRVARRIRDVSTFAGWVSFLGDPGDYQPGIPSGGSLGLSASTT